MTGEGHGELQEQQEGQDEDDHEGDGDAHVEVPSLNLLDFQLVLQILNLLLILQRLLFDSVQICEGLHEAFFILLLLLNLPLLLLIHLPILEIIITDLLHQMLAQHARDFLRLGYLESGKEGLG